jgi:hypothetical protein
MQTESHNTQSVYSTVLSAEPNWQYSWQSNEWQTYCNSKLNVTNCNENWKPQHTVCIQHCTVSWTKLTLQQAVRFNSRWRVWCRNVTLYVYSGRLTVALLKMLCCMEWHYMCNWHHDNWVPVTKAGRVLRLRMEERPPVWRVAADILNKQ